MPVTPETYLDNAATARPWPEVVDAVARAMGDAFGNASSLHRRGLLAARAIAEAEEAVVALVGGGAWKVIFTSGGSEADALAVLGAAPRVERGPALPHDDVARDDVLPGELLDAEPLASGVAAVTGRTLTLLVCHGALLPKR